MNTLTTHRKAERFARLIELDAHAPRLDGAGLSMRPAVTLTAALRSAGQISTPAPLSTEARLAMRQRLVAAASAPAEASLLSSGLASRAADTVAGRVNETAAKAKKATRRLSALVGSVVIVTSVSGVGVAAARSLPGSPFYDLKRATEHVQLWLASGAAAKGERHLDFARERLDEAQALGADSPYAASTLRSMNQETRQATNDLIGAYQSSGESEPLADLVVFTREQYAELLSFGHAAGDRLQAQTFYSLTLLTGIAQEIQSVSGTTCLTCIVTGGKPQSTPTPGSNVSPSPSPSPGGSSPSSSGSPSHPASTPPNLIPTGIIPTEVPTKLPTLPPLLHGKDGKKKGGALPTISPLPLLSALTTLMGG